MMCLWRFEASFQPTWEDGWKPKGYYRPRFRRINRGGPPPRAISFRFMRLLVTFWYRDRRPRHYKSSVKET